MQEENHNLPSAVLLICNFWSFPLTPLSVTGRKRSGSVVSSETALSVITIHGGSPSPVYLSTAALLNF